MVYLVGSLRNERIIEVTNALEAAGYDVFSDWYAAGPEADDYWQKYEKARGRTYREALNSPAARNVFDFDLRHIEVSDVVVLVAPAGKSAHLELGYAVGRGKLTFVLFDQEPERWDVMYQFATDVCTSVEELVNDIDTQTVLRTPILYISVPRGEA